MSKFHNSCYHCNIFWAKYLLLALDRGSTQLFPRQKSIWSKCYVETNNQSKNIMFYKYIIQGMYTESVEEMGQDGGKEIFEIPSSSRICLALYLFLTQLIFSQFGTILTTAWVRLKLPLELSSYQMGSMMIQTVQCKQLILYKGFVNIQIYLNIISQQVTSFCQYFGKVSWQNSSKLQKVKY